MLDVGECAGARAVAARHRKVQPYVGNACTVNMLTLHRKVPYCNCY